MPLPREEIWTAEITGIHRVTGVARTFYYSQGEYSSTPSDTPSSVSFRDRLHQPLAIQYSLWAGRQLQGSVEPSVGSIGILNGDGAEYTDLLKDYRFTGQQVVVKRGYSDQAYSTFETKFIGRTNNAPRRGPIITFSVADQVEALTKAASQKRFRGMPLAWVGDEATHIDVDITDHPEMDEEWTIEATIRLPSTALGNSSNTIYAFGDWAGSGAGNSIIFTVNQGFLSITHPNSGHTAGDGVTVSVPVNLADGVRRHVAVAFRPHEFYFYVDGELIETAPAGNEFTGNTIANAVIGDRDDGVGAWEFEGEMSEFRLWRVFRQPEEIAQWWDKPARDSEEHLHRRFAFDSGLDIANGITADPLGVTDNYDPAEYEDDSVFDTAGETIGVANTDLTYVVTGEGSEDLAGQRKQLPLGRVFNMRPDLTEEKSLHYTVSGQAVGAIRAVRDGGARLHGRPRLLVDSSTDRVEFTHDSKIDHSVTDSFTVELRLSLNSIQSGIVNYLLWGSGSGSQRIRILKDDSVPYGGFRLAYTDSASNTIAVVSATRPLLDTWDTDGQAKDFLISAVYDGNSKTLTLYLNGVKAGSSTNSSLSGNFNMGTALKLGATGTTCTVDAAYKELRWWNVARTPRQVFDNKDTVYVGTEDEEANGLVVYCDFSEGSGSSVVDKMPTNPLTGTITGSTWLPAQYVMDQDRRGFFLAAVPERDVTCDVEGVTIAPKAREFLSNNWVVFGDSSDWEFNPQSDEYFIEMWVQCYQDHTGYILSKKGNNSIAASAAGWAILTSSGTDSILMHLADGSSFQNVTIDTSLGHNGSWQDLKPHHLAIAFHGDGTMSAWWDFDLIVDSTAISRGSNANGESMAYGRRDNTSGTGPFHGATSEVRMWANDRSSQFFSTAFGSMTDLRIADRPEVLDGHTLVFYDAPVDDEGTTMRTPLDSGIGLSGTAASAFTHIAGPPMSTFYRCASYLLSRSQQFTTQNIDLTQLLSLSDKLGTPVGWAFRDESSAEAVSTLGAPRIAWRFERDSGDVTFIDYRAPEATNAWVWPSGARGGGGYLTMPAYLDLRRHVFNFTIDMSVNLRLPSQGVTNHYLAGSVGFFGIFVTQITGNKFLRVNTVAADGTVYTYTYSSALFDLGLEGYWNRIAVEFVAADDIHLYLNGTAIDDVIPTTTSTTAVYTNAWTIGNDASTYLLGTYGSITDFRVWLRSDGYDTWATQYVNHRLKGNEDRLICYLRMDEDEGATSAVNYASWGGMMDTPNDATPGVQSASYDPPTPRATFTGNPGDEPLYPYPDATFTETVADQTILNIQPEPAPRPTLAERVGYRRNFAAMEVNELAPGIVHDSATVRLLSREYSIESSNSIEARTLDELSDLGPILGSSMWDRSKAQIAADEMMWLYGRERQRFKLLTAETQAEDVLVGQRVRVVSDILGFPVGGQSFWVVYKGVDAANRQWTLGLFG